jgi:chromate transporter
MVPSLETRGLKSITVQIVQGLRGYQLRTGYALRVKRKPKRRGIGWRGMVHKSYSQSNCPAEFRRAKIEGAYFARWGLPKDASHGKMACTYSLLPQEERFPMEQLSQLPPGLRLLTFGHIFLRIGATAFGGLGATLALVERELVTKHQWLTAADVTEALTYTKLLPGSTGPQVVAYLGYKLGGWSGSAVATAAFVFPSALMMLVLAAAYVSVTAVPAMRPAINGLTAAVVGLLLATTYRLGKANIADRITLGIALASVVAGAVLGVSAALIVVVAGVLGLCLYSIPFHKQTAQEDTP